MNMNIGFCNSNVVLISRILIILSRASISARLTKLLKWLFKQRKSSLHLWLLIACVNLNFLNRIELKIFKHRTVVLNLSFLAQLSISKILMHPSFPFLWHIILIIQKVNFQKLLTLRSKRASKEKKEKKLERNGKFSLKENQKILSAPLWGVGFTTKMVKTIDHLYFY